MLHNQGIRTKLLAVLALPILALTLVAGAESLQAFGKAGQASQVEQFAIGSDTLGALVVSLQAERSVSAAFLNKRPVAAELTKARAATDAALLSSRALIGSVDLASLSPHATAAVVQADRGHAELKALRAAVSGGRVKAPQVFDQYSAIIARDVSLPQRIGDGLVERVTGGQLTAFSSAQQLVELATQEREVGLGMISAGAADPVSGAALARLAALQTETMIIYRRHANAAQAKSLDAALRQPVISRVAYRDLQRSMLAVGGGGRLRLDGSDWRNASNSRISALSGLAAPIAAEAGREAADAASSARNRALLVLAFGALLVALLVLMGSMLSRTITRPLRRLTEVAIQVRDMLPQMVERMATPGDGPGITMPEFEVGKNDEVGQLARVFRDVNTTTLRVAEEQAALRASIAEMFVNVARRNHVLLSRQLSFIDQLERSEENPDTLENLFRLDHLATRMRRNAESLIVLAGVDSGRRLRRPMPLSDVIRTAVSEIERYDRVDLALQADPPMVGHVALSAAHLLAELLENATQFSNPDTRVITSTAFTARGVRITVTDLGLGMTWDEISDANQRIANPPMSDVVGSQRLGFYVVGRLARRLDATVELKPGRAQGTIVTIDLPPGLFVPGSVIEGHGLHNEPLEPSPQPGPDDVSDLRSDAPSRASVLPTQAAGHAPVHVSDKSRLRAVDDVTQTKVEPRVPVSPAPFPDQPPPTDEAPPAHGSLLPRREAREGLPDAAPSTLSPRALSPRTPSPSTPSPSTVSLPTPSPPTAPAALAPPTADEPRTGIFSGFRARRALTPPTSPPLPTEPAALRALPQVDDAPTTFSAPQDASTTFPALEAAPTTVVPAPQDAPSVFLPAPQDSPSVFFPALEDAPSTFVPVLDLPVRRESTLPSREAATREPAPPADSTPSLPGPLDEGWRYTEVEPQVEAQPEPQQAPAVLEVVADLAVSVGHDDPQQQRPDVDSTSQPDDVAKAAEPDAAGWGARSALSELVHDTPSAAPAPQPAGADEPAPVRASHRAVASMDILPARGGGRGLRRRLQAKPAVQVAPVKSSLFESRVAGSPTMKSPVIAPPTTVSRELGSRELGSPEPVGVPEQPGALVPSLYGSVFDAPVPVASASPEPLRDNTPAGTAAVEPALSGLAAAQALRERSAMASQALSELSALSTYRPAAVTSAAATGLVRRTPQATPAGQLPAPVTELSGPRRPERNPADVRSMLSGFQAGVERGRTSPDAARDEDGASR